MVRPLAYHYYATSPIDSHIQIPSPKNSPYLHHQNISPSIYDTTNIANPSRYSPRNSPKQRQYTLLEEPNKNECSLPPRAPILQNTTVARVRRSILKNTIPVAPLISPKTSIMTHHNPQLFSQSISAVVRKKQSFDTSIERICLFSKNDTPKTILVSPRHTEQDLGDEFALTGSASPSSSSSSSDEDLFDFDLDLDDDKAKINKKKNDRKYSSVWEIVTSNVSSSYSSRKHLTPTPKVNMESLGIGSTTDPTISSSSTFSGTVLVENLSPIKQVIIRLTINNWKDFQDYPCKYQNVGFAGTERFSVSVPLETIFAENIENEGDDDEPVKKETQPVPTGVHKARFAVCYIDGTTDPREYWDNNSGMNYFVEFKKTPITKSASKTKPRSSTIPTRTNTFKSWNFRPALQPRKIVTRSPNKLGGITSPVSESPTENGKWFKNPEKKDGEETVGSLEIPYSKKASEYYLTHLAHL